MGMTSEESGTTKMIYVILGMHKSGTTLISQILHESGIEMVESASGDVSYDQGNKYERQAVLALNKEILGTQSDEVRDLPQPKQPVLSDEQRKTMQHIVAGCSARLSDWGMKDPRSAYTYRLWKEQLPEHKIIAIYRPAEEIWPRFRWKGLRKRYLNPIWAWQFIARWLEHNQNIIDYVEAGDTPYLLLDYREMMALDGEMKRLEAFVGQPLTDMRKKELYRTKTPKKDICLALAGGLIRRLRGQSANGVLTRLSELRAKQCAEQCCSETERA